MSFLIMQENILIGPFGNKSTTILGFWWWETYLYRPIQRQKTKIFNVSPNRRLQKYAGNPISKCKTPSKIVSKLISTLHAIFRTFKDCISLAGLRPTNYCMRPKNNNQKNKVHSHLLQNNSWIELIFIHTTKQALTLPKQISHYLYYNGKIRFKNQPLNWTTL